MRSLLIVAFTALLAACGQPQSTPKVDPEFGAKVRAYLLEHPEVLIEVSRKLEENQAADAAKKARENIGKLRPRLERDPRDRVLNPNGKITVVEFFDYNCGYCKVIAPEVLKIAAENPNVRIVLKDMVIFGETSEYAAAGAALASSPERFTAIHKGFMAAKPLNDDTASRILAANGVDPAAARRTQASPDRQRYLSDVHAMASQLGIEGTPAFIVGDTLIPGAQTDALRAAIAAELRK